MKNRTTGSAGRRGPIAWMARDRVSANLLMFFIVAAGLVSMTGLVQEAFPVLDFNAIEVSVAYPGATPSEVEESIILVIEERAAALDNVREVSSVAAEGVASVMVRFRAGADLDRALSDLDAAVNRIEGFPAGAERPVVRAMTNRQSVMRLVLYGDVPERSLKELAYRAEDEIASLPGISYVETSGVRAYEISVEVSSRRLRALGLTVADVAEAIRAGSADLPAGTIKARDAEVRLRTTSAHHDQYDLDEIVVLSGSDGATVRLGDIAEIRDGFQDVSLITRYNGRPAAFVEVYRSEDEQVLEVAGAVGEYIEGRLAPSLPAGVAVDVWNNDAEVYEDRLDLLLENGLSGLVLVLVTLTLFLRVRLAFWVALGVAVSFVGAFGFMFLLDVSINTVSLFAFLLVVGIVIDDAVVVAENVYAERQKGLSGVAAAISGVQRVKRPVTFSVLTTVAAFMPLMFLPGPIGAIFGSIPIIVGSVLIVSLAESLFILPSHLAHLPPVDGERSSRPERPIVRIQSHVDSAMGRFVDGPLDRCVRFATRQPAVVVSAGIGIIVLCVGLVASGAIPVVLIQSEESDIVVATLEMPEGTPAARTDELARDLEAAGRRAIGRLDARRPPDAEPLLVGVNSAVGLKPRSFGGAVVEEPGLNPQAHMAFVEFKLLEADRRRISANTFAAAWREEAGPMPEARSLAFDAALIDLGLPVQLEISHPDPERLYRIGDAVADRLRELEGVFDLRAEHARGVQELQLGLRPVANTLGLTLEDLASQARSSFFGNEAIRVQRGREEIRVYVRLPEEERNSLSDVRNHFVQTPSGSWVPLSHVAVASLGRSSPTIRRKDGRRVVTIAADVDPSVITGAEAAGFLEDVVLRELAEVHPDLTYEFGGQQQQQLESFDALGRSFAIALVAIYVLLAIPLGSYTKPLLVMSAVPFGLAGAVIGHLVLGLELSVSTVWGMVGLCGVVVNDALMLVDFIDERLRRGAPTRTAIIDAAKARFRPIFLTSVTTFAGFAPLIFETSLQARFLIPMAVSIGFGVLFATVVLMLVVPALAAVFLPTRHASVVPVTVG